VLQRGERFYEKRRSKRRESHVEEEYVFAASLEKKHWARRLLLTKRDWFWGAGGKGGGIWDY